jgi:hypothetical protein
LISGYGFRPLSTDSLPGLNIAGLYYLTWKTGAIADSGKSRSGTPLRHFCLFGFGRIQNTLSGDEIFQIITIRPICSKSLLIEQALDTAPCADLIALAS